MTFKKNFIVSLLALAGLFAATQSFAGYCYWPMKDGTKKLYNVEESIINGVAEENIERLHSCCDFDPGPCGKYWVGDKGYYNVQLAAKYNRTKTVKYLLKYRGCGETIDRFGIARDEVPYNALMFAISHANKDMVLWLLHYKADPTVKNTLGRDSKYYAEQLDKTKGDNGEIIKMVVDAWNKVMGYSSNMIKQKKDELIKELNGQASAEKLQMLKDKYIFKI